MDAPSGLGRLLVLAGLGIAVVGGVLWLGEYLPAWLRPGRLPGDIHIERPGFSFFLPITTMILLSAGISGIIWLIRWWTKQ